MGVKKWEEYLWKDLSIVPVPDLKAGSIKLLDIFAQNGASFRKRAMVRIGSMISLGDKTVDGWLDKREELSQGLRSLSTDSVAEPFVRAYEGHDRTFEGSTSSKFLASLFRLAKLNLGESQKLKIELRSPLYYRYEEDALIELIECSDWKPDVGKINKVERKGASCWGQDNLLELWIITELKYAGSIGYTITRSSNVGANVHMPGAELVAGVIVAGALDFSISNVDSRPATNPTNDDILYGFKAVRVKFDKDGEYISRKGQDNMGRAMPTVRGDDAEFNPDEDPEYHMGGFFFENSGDDEGTSSGDLECLPQFLIEDENEDQRT
jgi:hypothetical protein